MSRVIKFRAWVEHEDKISGKNNYSYMQENLEFQGSINAIFATSGIEPLNLYGCKVTYMQFTGLNDKNDVEIYEGDVYHHGDPRITYTVVWHDSGLMGKQNGSSSFAGLSHWQDRIEVIGNVFEHPELIGVTK